MIESKMPWDTDYPVTLTIGLAIGNRHDTISPREYMSRKEWESLDFDKQCDWLDQTAREWAFEYIEFSWDVPKS